MQVITLILPGSKNSNHFHSLRLVTPVFHRLLYYIHFTNVYTIVNGSMTFLIMHYVLGVFLGVSFSISYKHLVVVNKLDC